MYIERGLKWPWDDEEQRADEDPDHASTEEALAGHQEEAEEAKEDAKGPAYVPPPITLRLDVRDFSPQKRQAAAVHRTQFSPDGPFLTMPDDIANIAFGEEHYSLIESRMPTPEQEHDLFDDLTLTPAPNP